MELALSFVSLWGLLALVVWGLFSRWYDENLAQCVGLVCILVWALAELHTLHRFRWVSVSDNLLHVGLFIFALGTASRAAYYARKARP